MTLVHLEKAPRTVAGQWQVLCKNQLFISVALESTL